MSGDGVTERPYSARDGAAVELRPASEAIDLIVRTANPTALDDTVQQLPMCAAAVVDGSFNGDTCRLRVFGGLGFLRFAITQQGYGEIVGEEPVDG